MSISHTLINYAYFTDVNLKKINPVYCLTNLEIRHFPHNANIFNVQILIACKYNDICEATNMLSCIVDIDNIEYSTRILLDSGFITDVSSILDFIIGYRSSNRRHKYVHEKNIYNNNLVRLSYQNQVFYEEEDITIHTNSDIIHKCYNKNKGYDDNHAIITYCKELQLYVIEYFCTIKDVMEHYIIYKDELTESPRPNITRLDIIAREHSNSVTESEELKKSSLLIPDLNQICLSYTTFKPIVVGIYSS